MARGRQIFIKEAKCQTSFEKFKKMKPKMGPLASPRLGVFPDFTKDREIAFLVPPVVY
jgi:hypothetical protein